MIKILLLLLLLAACAPMPGTTLFPELTHPTPIEQVEVVVTIDAFETQKYCWESIPTHQKVLSCILNACWIPACAMPFRNTEGDIKKCYVYLSFDNDYLREHELKHCEGFKDVFY